MGNPIQVPVVNSGELSSSELSSAARAQKREPIAAGQATFGADQEPTLDTVDHSVSCPPSSSTVGSPPPSESANTGALTSDRPSSSPFGDHGRGASVSRRLLPAVGATPSLSSLILPGGEPVRLDVMGKKDTSLILPCDRFSNPRAVAGTMNLYCTSEESEEYRSWRACIVILGTELSECLAFGGIARNLVSYLTGDLEETNAAAAGDLSMWTGTCFLTPLVGAYLADSCWGRYTTIVVFLSVYIMGLIILTLSASFPTLMWSSMAVRRGVVHLGLYLVSFGTGGIKPSVCPFGAEQFDDAADPAQSAAKASFFNWYFFVVNIGSLLASTLVVWVQDRVGWWLGFGIPTAAMAAALTVFVGCKSLYWFHDQKPTAGSPLTRVCQVVAAAVSKRGAELPGDLSLLHDGDGDGDSYRIGHTDEFRFLDKAAVVEPGDLAVGANPWRMSTVTRVEEVKMLLRLLAMWPTVVFFFAVTAQMTSTFVEQGAAMDTRVGAFDVPPATLSSLEVVSILLCIPAYNAVLVPIAGRVTGDGRGLTQLQRLGVGLALATLTMAYMALVEAKRLAAAAAASPVSIVWQAPAYVALGTAEVFTSVGLLEFYYDQSPEAMKSLCTAVSLLAVAAGNYLNSAIVAVVAWATTWIPQDLNQGRLDCFFWMMAALSSINLLGFVCSSMRYKYREKC